MISNEILIFTAFSIFVVGVLIFDLKFVGRNSHVVSYRESLIWTAVWVACALGFYAFLLFHGEKLHGIADNEKLHEIASKYAPNLKLTGDFENSVSIYRKNMAMEYITGYLIEYTLSIDNIFVIMMILTSFSVNVKYYKRVLFWGIFGAIVLRFFFIFTGSALIQKFQWILLLFGAFLVFSGIKMFIDRNKDEKIEPQKHWLVKYLSRHFRIYPRYVKDYFVIRKNKIFITPLLIVIILIEFTDLIFAFDSIPAIFAVTIDPFIVFFSNIFAIIGLRSLFFLLSKIVDLFRFLKIGVSVLLVFIGFKLLFHKFLDEIGFETIYSLYFILFVLLVSIISSLLFPAKAKLQLRQ